MKNRQRCLLAEVKSPKSCAFPVDDMVTKSIIFTCGENPPPKTPLVEDEQLARDLLPSVNFQSLVHFLV
jgi:hypothetical protein